MNKLNKRPDETGTDFNHHSDKRVLHPVRDRDNWPRLAPEGEAVRRIAVIDCETTGLAVERHQIIELCMAIVLVNDAGRIVAVEVVRSGLVDPGHPLSAKIVELTGLTDTELAGRSIDDDQVAEMLTSCDGAVAFNAGFDRPYIEKMLGRHGLSRGAAQWLTCRGARSGLSRDRKATFSIRLVTTCLQPTARRTMSLP